MVKITTNEECDEVFQSSAKLISKYAFVQNKENISNLDQKSKDLSEGVTGLRSVLAYYPEHWQSYYFIGKAYQAVEQNELAYNEFKNSHNLNPEQQDVAREYSVSCMELEKYDEAIDIAKKAVDLSPNDSGLYANLALAFVLDKDISNALDVIEKSVQINPDDNISNYLLKTIKEIKEGKRPQPKKASDLLA
jgi:tetratricopeptide (TPR) repeat protein